MSKLDSVKCHMHDRDIDYLVNVAYQAHRAGLGYLGVVKAILIAIDGKKK